MRAAALIIFGVFIAESSLAQSGRAYRDKYSKALQQMYAPKSKDFNVGLAYKPYSDSFADIGFTGTYQTSKRWQWGWSLMYGTTTNTFFQVHAIADNMHVDEVAGSELNTHAFFRYAMFNWAYMSGGLGYRTGRVNGVAAASSDKDSNVDLDVAFSSITIPLGIGTQWTFAKRYTFNIDWIEYQIAIAGSATSSSSQFQTANSEANKTVGSFESDLQNQFERGNFALLRMTFGFKF